MAQRQYDLQTIAAADLFKVSEAMVTQEQREFTENLMMNSVIHWRPETAGERDQWLELARPKAIALPTQQAARSHRKKPASERKRSVSPPLLSDKKESLQTAILRVMNETRNTHPIWTANDMREHLRTVDKHPGALAKGNVGARMANLTSDGKLRRLEKGTFELTEKGTTEPMGREDPTISSLIVQAMQMTRSTQPVWSAAEMYGTLKDEIDRRYGDIPTEQKTARIGGSMSAMAVRGALERVAEGRYSLPGARLGEGEGPQSQESGEHMGTAG